MSSSIQRALVPVSEFRAGELAANSLIPQGREIVTGSEGTQTREGAHRPEPGRSLTAAALLLDGERRRGRATEAGITLIELLVVMAIVSAMMAIAYPNVTSGLEGIRLKAAIDRAGQFWIEARQHADRYQTPVQVAVDPEKNQVLAVAATGVWRSALEQHDSLKIVRPAARVVYVLYPGAPSPAFRLMLEGEAGGSAGVKINVFTGVPEEWDGT